MFESKNKCFLLGVEILYLWCPNSYFLLIYIKNIPHTPQIKTASNKNIVQDKNCINSMCKEMSWVIAVFQNLAQKRNTLTLFYTSFNWTTPTHVFHKSTWIWWQFVFDSFASFHQSIYIWWTIWIARIIVNPQEYQDKSKWH